MTEFRCLTVDPNGKSAWRKLNAASEEACVGQLLADGFTPLEVKSGAADLSEILSRPVELRLGGEQAEQALLLNQLAVLVGSGLPIDRSLDLLRDQASKARQKNLLADVLADVKAGNGLASALEARAIFPAYVVGVVRAAEKGGHLGDALSSVAQRMTRATETRQKLMTALTYPAAVLAATIGALILVLTLVVPQFEPIFEGSEDKLPALTQLVLILSGLLQSYGALIVFVCLAFPIGFWLFLRSEAGQSFRQKYAWLIPGMKLRDQYIAAQFTGLVATLLQNGVTVVRALPLARQTIASKRWQGQLEKVEQRVREGIRLSYALQAAPVFPSTASRLIEVGERTGKLSQTCMHASKIIGDAATARIERIVSLVNPIAIILLGGVVAMMVAGVMLGIFALGDFAG